MEDLFVGWETFAPSANCSQEPPVFAPPPPLDFFGLSSGEEDRGWLDSSFGSFARWFEDLDEPVALPPQTKGVPRLSPSSGTDLAASMESDDGIASSVSASSPRSSVEDMLEELMLERETLENARPPVVESPPASLVPPSPSLLQLNPFVGRVPAIGSGLHFLTARGRGRRASGAAAAGAKRKQRKEGRDKQKKGRRGKNRSMEGKRVKNVSKKKRRVEERSV
ncbi:hypothetical protein QOT17_016482 [Balamuthia mandrillaris]